VEPAGRPSREVTITKDLVYATEDFAGEPTEPGRITKGIELGGE
jgi:hypothetical protein